MKTRFFGYAFPIDGSYEKEITVDLGTYAPNKNGGFGRAHKLALKKLENLHPDCWSYEVFPAATPLFGRG